jgi:hypothetical protein
MYAYTFPQNFLFLLLGREACKYSSLVKVKDAQQNSAPSNFVAIILLRFLEQGNNVGITLAPHTSG